MPIYEYNCPGCGKPFEKRVGFAEADERQECPHCGNKHARRQLSLIASTRTGDGNSAPSAPVFRAPT
jgi:putative FmdB family regulatory protein